MSQKQYEDHHVEDQPLECELQGEDLNGLAYKMVRVANRTTSWARKNNMESGESTIFATGGAEINDDAGELIIPSDSTILVSYAFFLPLLASTVSQMIATYHWHTTLRDISLVAELAETTGAVTTGKTRSIHRVSFGIPSFK